MEDKIDDDAIKTQILTEEEIEDLRKRLGL
jgi:hypothetical protein